MLEDIKDLFSGIFDFFELMLDAIGSAVQALWYAVTYLVNGVALIDEFSAYVPPIILGGFITMVILSVVFLILGR